MITSLIAREMGVDFGYDFSASMVFKSIADSTPAYDGLRYPHLKDESEPVQVKHAIGAGLDVGARLRRSASGSRLCRTADLMFNRCGSAVNCIG